MSGPPVLVVFGARNVGRAIAADRLAAGWRVLAVARGQETLDSLRAAHPEVVAVRGDAGDHAVVAEALGRAERDLGGPGPDRQRHHLRPARPQLRRRAR